MRFTGVFTSESRILTEPAVGIGVSFLLMLTFVPSIRELLDRRAEKHERLEVDGLEGGDARALPRLIGKTAVLPKRMAVGTLIVALVLTGAGAYGMSNLSTNPREST